jgi:two-component system sensor histidine kinase PilS (NtrC family)
VPVVRATSGIPSAPWLLQWAYLGRVIVSLVVFVVATFYFRALPPEFIVILAFAALASVVASGLSFWHTHIRRASPGMTFLYAQAVFDLALVTTVVHVTEGANSQFPALYILVIGVSAVLMPMASSLLVTSLAGLLYLADIALLHPEQLSVVVWLQISVFVTVSFVTGFLASRVRVMGAEREVLQKEVRRLRLEAADILRNIRSGVLTVDGSGMVAYANPAARQLLQLPSEPLLGRSLEELLGNRVPDLLRAIEVTQTSRRKALRSEGRVETAERSFPIGVTTTRIDSGGDGPPSVTAIFTDISDQKRVEALHLRTERLEAIAELSSSLAHEIRNPLASIRSSIEQLAKSSRADEDESFLTELILRESDRLSRLLSEFLDFSRVRVTNCRELELGEVVESALGIVRQHPDCPETATITVDRAPVTLEGDEDLLHRVVFNLVLNAMQASEGKANVTVEVRDATAEDLPQGVTLGPAVLLRVADDGPGILPELRDRLFEPFVSGRTGGSGLGLAIVQRAVMAHRGVVLVDSTPGGGTVFSVVIPSKGTSEAAA